MSLPDDFPFLHKDDAVEHKVTGRVGRVSGFDLPGMDVFVDGTGPYPQTDFRKLSPVLRRGEPGAPANEDGSCSCRTFSECTHK